MGAGAGSQISLRVYIRTRPVALPTCCGMFTTAGFARLVELAGVAAKIALDGMGEFVLPAGSCWPTQGTTQGYCRRYLGHRNIQHTVRYTELLPNRFKNFWKGRTQADPSMVAALAT
jgi:hypothetical protein